MASNDSRFSARKLYKKLHLNLLFNTSSFIGNFVIAAVISYFFRELGYGDEVNFVFFITILSIGLWITEAVPPFAVGIFIVCMMLLGFGTDYLFEDTSSVEMYVDTWTSNVIWLLLGGFFLAEGMKQVQLDRYLFRFTVRRFGNSPVRLLGGLMLVTALASMIMSNTATTAMMVSSVLPLIHLLGKEHNYSRALLTGIPAAATVGGIGTIIGSTPNAIAVGALNEIGMRITFIEWMAIGVPTALILIFLFNRYLTSRLKLMEVEIDLSELPKSERRVDKTKRRAVVFTIVLTMLLWLTEPVHGIPVAATSAVPILLLTMTQVISANEVRKLPWDTLMLVAGGLALGIALVDVGLAEIAMNQITKIPVEIAIIAFLFSIIGVMLSNVMSNTAAASILVPIAIALPAPFGIAVPVMVAISCSCALLLPVSTPSNAVAYATGMVEQKEYRRGGFFFMIVGPISAFVSVLIWAWFYI